MFLTFDIRIIQANDLTCGARSVPVVVMIDWAIITIEFSGVDSHSGGFVTAPLHQEEVVVVRVDG